MSRSAPSLLAPNASHRASTSTVAGMQPALPQRERRSHPHPYLSGNFAPIHKTCPLTPCQYSGTIPQELYGGEYVRNGGNPVSNEDLGRDAHWFDGDGMLSGVAFTRTASGVEPEFVNQYILTDVYLSTVSSKYLSTPILPSIATLVNPLSSLYRICTLVFRSILLVILSRLPGSHFPIRRISVANTGVLFHDGRALATCESGPPMRIALPGLETVGWYNGQQAEGELGADTGVGFGGSGILGFVREWTTAHPRVDVRTGELILFHSTFMPPYVQYSIIPRTRAAAIPTTPTEQPVRLLHATVPGISSAKMMHDFGISCGHTVIMDLPLSLDPLNLAKNKPVVAYDPSAKARFGVFPRHHPDRVRWFETTACCIFHTANTWDSSMVDKETGRRTTTAVNMLACRLTSAAVVFSAGDIAAPQPVSTPADQEQEQCRLYYYQFRLADDEPNRISFQFGLSAIPFEFPSTREDRAMRQARYVYGCSTTQGSFDAALGRAVKIDCLVKMDADSLIQRGIKNPDLQSIKGCADTRTVGEVLESDDPSDPISIFRLPHGWYAQEPRFIPRENGTREDDGWLLTYVFDESQLDPDGECRPNATSELWIIDARDMATVVARIKLTQRVSYGLHGNFFSEDQVKSQRPIETIRRIKRGDQPDKRRSWWQSARDAIERFVG